MGTKGKRWAPAWQQADDICARYLSGQSARIIAGALGLTMDGVLKVVRDMPESSGYLPGRKTLTKHRPRKQYVADYFAGVLSERPAYFLGLLLADGYLTRSGVGIDLQPLDLHILETLRDEIVPDGIIRKYASVGGYKAHDKHRLLICCPDIRRDLVGLGVIEHKSLHLSLVPHVPAEVFPHFVRGYIDGNGCITRADVGNHVRVRFSIRGNEPFLCALQKMLPGKWYLTPDGVCSQLSTSTHTDAVLVGKWLYRDASVFLVRKFEKFSAFAQ